MHHKTVVKLNYRINDKVSIQREKDHQERIYFITHTPQQCCGMDCILLLWLGSLAASPLPQLWVKAERKSGHAVTGGRHGEGT